MKEYFTYIGDKLLPNHEASLPIGDLAIQRGYGIFDFFRVQNRKPLFLIDHLERLFHSAQYMRLDHILERGKLEYQIANLIERNDLDHSGMRIMVTGGDSTDGYTIREPKISIVQQQLAPPPNALPENGIRLVSYEYQRQLSSVKTTDYLMAIWLQPWMKENQGDDILYHQKGSISECPRSNIFIITKNLKLVTPKSGMLAGITRKNIIRAAGKLNMIAEERTVQLQEVIDAAGVFICSTTKRIMPVATVDGISISHNGARPMIQELWNELLKMEEAS